MYLNASDDPDAQESESVYVIYVKGDNKELGSTYELSLPEGSQVAETIHKGDDAWRYSSESDSYSYYDEEDRRISDTYYYTDRVVVKAKNGAERVYVIAYAQDQSGTEVKGIKDDKNSYVNTEISTSTKTMYLNASDDPDAPGSERVYVIYVKGDTRN